MSANNIRCPDFSYTRKERVPGGKPPKTFGVTGPDLCVEVISPSEDQPDMMQKVQEYFDSGAQQVWHIFPETQSVVVHTSPTDAKSLSVDDMLSVPDLLPGFSCRISELFAF